MKINLIIYLKNLPYQMLINVLIRSLTSSHKNVLKDLQSYGNRKVESVELIKLERERDIREMNKLQTKIVERKSLAVVFVKYPLMY